MQEEDNQEILYLNRKMLSKVVVAERLSKFVEELLRLTVKPYRIKPIKE